MIQIVKLLTGEEIVGEVVVEDKITIKDPCILQMVPSRGNPEQAAMALIPIAMHIDNKSISVKEEHVIWMAKPIKELYNQYNSAFGSGIQLAGF